MVVRGQLRCHVYNCYDLCFKGGTTFYLSLMLRCYLLRCTLRITVVHCTLRVILILFLLHGKGSGEGALRQLPRRFVPAVDVRRTRYDLRRSHLVTVDRFFLQLVLYLLLLYFSDSISLFLL